jgi:asparagine synthase (glutamine-hydrolysing)
MCGIAGFINFKNQKIDNSSLIKEMIDKLYFRGPDENGFFIWKNVALGIARLKIIDLLKGSQPISNESKNLVIVFNGEIYNYKELREELILKNHHFKTDSDTEVILHLYEEEKENMFEKLNGMFAFAIFDKNEKNF